MDIIVIIASSAAVLIILWLLMLMPGRRKNTLLEKLKTYKFAHRGLHGFSDIPENSVRAFKLAIEMGYASELDVHLSKDGRLVVMHDANLKRMCGINKNICDMTGEELSELKLGETGESIPFFEDVLPLFENKAPLLIEIKTTVGNVFKICRALFNVLDDYKGVYCIESFDPRVLLWLRFKRPDVVRGQLSGYINKHGEKLFFLGDFALKNLLVNCIGSPDFIAYRFDDRNSPSLRLCKKLYDVPIFYWTITSEKQQKAAEAEGGTIIFERFFAEKQKV